MRTRATPSHVKAAVDMHWVWLQDLRARAPACASCAHRRLRPSARPSLGSDLWGHLSLLSLSMWRAPGGRLDWWARERRQVRSPRGGGGPLPSVAPRDGRPGIGHGPRNCSGAALVLCCAVFAPVLHLLVLYWCSVLVLPSTAPALPRYMYNVGTPAQCRCSTNAAKDAAQDPRSRPQAVPRRPSARPPTPHSHGASPRVSPNRGRSREKRASSPKPGRARTTNGVDDGLRTTVAPCGRRLRQTKKGELPAYGASGRPKRVTSLWAGLRTSRFPVVSLYHWRDRPSRRRQWMPT